MASAKRNQALRLDTVAGDEAQTEALRDGGEQNRRFRSGKRRSDADPAPAAKWQV